jgi:hypothetical protein
MTTFLNRSRAVRRRRRDLDRHQRRHFTQKAVARPVIAPPGIPAARLMALRAGFIALAQDNEFLADAKKTRLDVASISGEAVDKVISLITSASPEAAERLAKAIAPVDKR